jgi:hypothetical protein
MDGLTKEIRSLAVKIDRANPLIQNKSTRVVGERLFCRLGFVQSS